jgi:hypothetical protein
LITSVDNDEDCIERLKKVDLVDVIIWLSEAWNEMSSLSLVRSWKILLEHEASHKWKEPPKETDNETTNKDTQLISLLKQMPGCESADQEDIQEWMGNDDEEEFTEDDIVEMVTNEANGPVNNENEGDQDQINKIPHTEGFKAIEMALEYISQQDEVTPSDIICFRKWRDIAAKKRSHRQKQTSLDDFLKKY